jgi:hypothetical protein
MGFEDEAQRSALSFEGRQELHAAVRRRQHAMYEVLERGALALRRVGHARLEVPARTVVVAQPRAFGTGLVLHANSAERDVAQ